MENIIATMKSFLEKYGYTTTEKGLKNIWEEYLKNKGNLLEKFRKHPNWDEDNLAIVFKEEYYKRPFDSEAMYEFNDWTKKQLKKIASEIGYDTTNIEDDLSELRTIVQKLENCRDRINSLHDRKLADGIIVNGDAIEIKSRISNLRKEIAEKHENRDVYDCYWIPNEEYKKFESFDKALYYIYRNCKTQYISAEQAQEINEKINVEAKEGQKLTRIIQKLCKVVGIDKIKEIRPRIDGSEEMKDFGFNYRFALLADRINPVRYKRITVISLNPLDYWGMSFGYKWASCHTIDKANVRNVGSNHYQGCYSSGTESYMLDSSSIIYYVIKEDYEGNTYWNEDKMQRCVFAVNEDGTVLLESRVYPDGRDGGDDTIAAQFRNVMQKVIADINEYSNYWTVKKGKEACGDYVSSFGTHYRDYNSYSDCNISLLKEAVNHPVIRVGHNPICPTCGREHRMEENIMCEYCIEEFGTSGSTCENCYEVIGDDEVVTSDGHHYCCSQCASEAGCEYCEDTDEWEDIDNLYYCEDDYCYHNEENSYKDARTGNYYSGEPEITTEDGNYYHSYENAEADGYVQTYEGYWYKEDECFTDNDGYWHCKDEGFETEDGTWFYYEADAEERGYIYTVDEKWYTVEDAESEGYHEDEFGNWVLNDESEEIA